ncbi:hypothetical protein AHMF7605_25815 [Adhaeribacter arboris]|uniref:Histidine kinase n=1 Tax=Adhaeribacter arboris TaxID=2072846 RepID=A0A2T2YMC7_9BACT|nr:response regulator [Adhaeribacter arboris]PSR56668.1 hypothetical protein AHMF7605_25815 [Adhaeribacter arboris]
MEFIQQLIEINPNPIYVRNEQGKFVFMNEAFAQLYGQSASALLDKGGLDPDLYYDKDLEIIKSHSQVTFEEFYKQQNGQVIWFNTTKKAFTALSGTRFLLSTSNDITKFKEIIQKNQEPAKYTQLFLSTLIKEFKADINTISGITSFLKKGNIHKEQEGYLNLIQKVAGNLLETPAQILEFSKLQTSNVEFKTTTFDITSILQYIISALVAQAEDHDVLLQIGELAPNLPLVKGDLYRLNQIITNLIYFSIKHTSNGRILVSSRMKEKIEDVVYVEFSIQASDWSHEIDKLKFFFNNPSKNESNEEYAFNHSDIGLKICKKIIELQGGQIWLETKLKKEIQFSFVLPFPLSENLNASKDLKIPENSNDLKGLHILLAEDNPANQLLVVSQLKFWETQVEVAHDGKEAWEKAKAKPYDLILMDIDMPHMNGIEATAIIRKEPNPNQSTPIIAFTANALKIDVNKYKESGFSDYLFKPYPEANLYLTVTRNIAAKDQLDEIANENESSFVIENTQEQLTDYQPSKESESTKYEPALYDFSGLGNLAEDADFVRKMQQLFIDLVPGQLDKLSSAISQKDWNTVAQIAHSLKSTYGNIGIVEAAQAAMKMEELSSKKTSLPELDILLQTVLDITEKVIAIFQEQLHAEVKS